ncbi:MAG: AAA family ATPase [Gammaproteobacteria bacterium]|nr:AAA family ATPase [Gammaproteobacteria bacterium]
MRLNSLWIDRFKNLRNFGVDFQSCSPYMVLVGENGSGKSNLLEAITLIFRNADLNLRAAFGYRIAYTCRGNELEVSARNGSWPICWIRTEGQGTRRRLSRKEFMADDDDGKPLYRPAFVFGYYSGPSDRLAHLYDRHRDRYYNSIIRSSEQRTRAKGRDPNTLRRLFYAQTLHGQFALLAFFMEPDGGPEGDQGFLREKLQIEALDSVLFVLKQPGWRRKGDDGRFWNAEGEVREFLGRLYAEAMCPLRMERRVAGELARSSSVECLYLFLPGANALERVYEEYSNQYGFFTALESMHLSEVLAEVRTRVRMSPSGGGGEVTYRDLSEGEQQLLLVLGLLKFTARDEALFLLDEPDTHLNPLWSAQYLGFLDRFIADRESCHVFMTTHDPLVLSRLRKEEVRILRRGEDGNVEAEAPMLDPRGMGVGGILTSDLFGLRTTLDEDTQSQVERQRELALKPELEAEEESELRQLTDALTRLGFSTAGRDPLYQRFLRKWTQRASVDAGTVRRLSAAELREEEALVAEIAEELAAEIAAERDHQQ